MPESLLRYWREDPLFSEHHEHWHLVYPYAGRLDQQRHSKQELRDIADDRIKPRFLLWDKRHGELFAYMHSQLLARYSAERLSVGLPPVAPLSDYRQPIPEGYIPNMVVVTAKGLKFAGNRPDNAVLNDITSGQFATRPGAQINSHELFRDRWLAVLGTPQDPNRPADISELAERIEPTDRFGTAYFGALHNDGHLLIALHNNNNDPDHPGCMFWEEAAVRDPVFYRWHTHIDSLFRKCQDALVPYDFSDLPLVEAVGLSVVPSSGRNNELVTEMRSRFLGAPFNANIDYLSHEDFTYLIEASNKTTAEVTVSVRIFLAPESDLNDRRAWIEMDKFRHVLPASSTVVVSRDSRDSSVVRHPIRTAAILEGTEPEPDDSEASLGCRCGWPYTLLLPRGKPEGMYFRFVALLTPGGDLKPHSHGKVGSSYCGVADSEYPDRRAMGYPFDRPFNTSIRDWVTGVTRPTQLTSALVSIIHT